jgi:hypothetical protein
MPISFHVDAEAGTDTSSDIDVILSATRRRLKS